MLAQATLMVKTGQCVSLGFARVFLLCRVISSVAGESLRAILDDEFSPSEQHCHPVSAGFVRGAYWLLCLVTLS